MAQIDNSLFLEIIELLTDLKIWSNADEISIAYEGNSLSLHFYFYHIDMRVHVSYTQDMITLSPADLRDVIMSAVNEEKDKRGITHTPQDDL